MEDRIICPVSKIHCVYAVNNQSYSNCICKDHRNEIEAPDPVVKDISNQL